MKLWHAMARGFTLIEMAIVLVVIGLILSGGLLAVSPVLLNSKINETKATMERIETALVLYGIQNGCLPCPANGAIATGATNFGEARHSAGYYTTGCTPLVTNTCVVTDGVVPWRNLGLSEADITDAWNNRIRYQLSSGTTSACTDGGDVSTRNNDLQFTDGFERDGSVTSCYPYGAITLQDTASNTIIAGGASEGAAIVLISHGPDGDGGFAAGTGTQKSATSGSTTQAENTDNDTTFVQDDPITVEGSTYFDDIVRWRTAPMLIQLCGSGACGNPS